MADWYGHARSNYFRVKDKDSFIQWAVAIEDLEVIEDGKGRVGLLSATECGGLPRERYDEETDEYQDIDFFKELADHLQEGSVAVFIEVGAERPRYVAGWALAVNSKGERVRVTLDDIYDLARPLGNEVTLADY